VATAEAALPPIACRIRERIRRWMLSERAQAPLARM